MTGHQPSPADLASSLRRLLEDERYDAARELLSRWRGALPSGDAASSDVRALATLRDELDSLRRALEDEQGARRDRLRRVRGSSAGARSYRLVAAAGEVG